MKKVICFFVFFLLGIVGVRAEVETYYSPYSSYSPYAEGIAESSDTMLVESVRRYQWYQERLESGGYYIEGENPSAYPLADFEDGQWTSFSPWQESVPETKKNRQVATKEQYFYQKLKDVQYISLSDVNGLDGIFRLVELSVLYRGNPLSFMYQCQGCSEDFSSYLQNHQLKENNSYLENGGALLIDLGGTYDASDLKIVLSFYEPSAYDTTFTMKVGNDASGKIGYLQESYSLNLMQNTLESINPLVFTPSAMGWGTVEWQEKVPTDVFLDSTNMVNYTKEISYQYRDKLYPYSRIIRQYQNGFYEDLPGFLKDFTRYRDYSRFKTRSYFRLLVPLVITNLQMSLRDFIVEDSTGLVVIETNLSPFKNGVYELTFTLPWQVIKKKVVVAIPTNESSFPNLKEELDQLEQQLLSQNKEIWQLNHQYQQMLASLMNPKLRNDEQLFQEKLASYFEEFDSFKKDPLVREMNWVKMNQEIAALKNSKNSEGVKKKQDVSLSSLVVPVIIVLCFCLLSFLKKRNL